MKNLQVLLTLALLASIAYSESLGGYSNITIYGNGDPNACTLTLSMNVSEDNVTFTEVVNNTGESCTYQDLYFASAFRGDVLNGSNITLVNTSNANVYEGVLTVNDVVNNNGTACSTLSNSTNASVHHVCRFKYGSVFFQVNLFTNATTGKFDTNWTDLIFPNYGTTNVNSTNGTNLLTPNGTFPMLVAMLYNACGSWSTVISDPNASIIVTGTEYASNTVDLYNYFSNFTLKDIHVRQRNASQDQYIVYEVTEDLFPFANNGTNGCHTLNLTWGTVLNNNWTYCAAGCDVSFILREQTAYLLTTSGITTQSQNLRNLLRNLRHLRA